MNEIAVVATNPKLPKLPPCDRPMIDALSVICAAAGTVFACMAAWNPRYQHIMAIGWILLITGFTLLGFLMQRVLIPV